MEQKLRVAVYGRSLYMRALATSLKANADLEPVLINPDSPADRQSLVDLAPSVVVFDLIRALPEMALTLLREREELLLIGVDPRSSDILVLIGQALHAVKTQDLVQLILESNADNQLV